MGAVKIFYSLSNFNNPPWIIIDHSLRPNKLCKLCTELGGNDKISKYEVMINMILCLSGV